MDMHAPIIALALGQIHDAVATTGSKLLEQGGFAAVAVISLAATALVTWLFLREQAVNRKLADANRDIAIDQVRLNGKMTDAIAANAAAIRALAAETRTLSERIRTQWEKR